jgi:hypothetical protein
MLWVVVGLERGPVSLVSTIEELLERKSSGSGIENRDYGRRGSAALTTRYTSIRKSWQLLRRQAAVARSVQFITIIIIIIIKAISIVRHIRAQHNWALLESISYHIHTNIHLVVYNKTCSGINKWFVLIKSCQLGPLFRWWIINMICQQKAPPAQWIFAPH